jgi:hypothetical protein
MRFIRTGILLALAVSHPIAKASPILFDAKAPARALPHENHAGLLHVGALSPPSIPQSPRHRLTEVRT